MLPCFIPVSTKLLAESGNPIGTIAKILSTLPHGRTHMRIRLDANALTARPSLRDDLLAHRLNIACELTPQGRRLVLAPKIAFQKTNHQVVPIFPWLTFVA